MKTVSLFQQKKKKNIYEMIVAIAAVSKLLFSSIIMTKNIHSEYFCVTINFFYLDKDLK